MFQYRTGFCGVWMRSRDGLSWFETSFPLARDFDHAPQPPIRDVNVVTCNAHLRGDGGLRRWSLRLTRNQTNK